MMEKRMPSPSIREISSTFLIIPFTERLIHHRTRAMSSFCFCAVPVLWLSIWTIQTKLNAVQTYCITYKPNAEQFSKNRDLDGVALSTSAGAFEMLWNVGERLEIEDDRIKMNDAKS
jgi:hypothetical protein